MKKGSVTSFCDVAKENKKSRRYKNMAHVITNECIACGACEGTCPVEAIKLGENGIYVIDPEVCVDCGACKDGCPVEAIHE